MVNVSTSIYTTRGKTPLKLDIYADDHYTDVARRSVVISIHNGNFLGGNRSDAVHQISCRHFAEKGFLSVSIDYRQGLKRVAFRPDTILRAILMGVKDVFAATDYLLQHADELRIDPDRIILMGGGAGGCIALTAEYELCQGRHGHLPAAFRFACIVSNSGAMATSERVFTWNQTPCPTVIVQGEGIGDIPSGYFYVPGLLWVGGRRLHDELSQAGGRNIFLDISGLEHNAFDEGSPDEQGITGYLDSVVLWNIEMLTK